MQHHYRPAGVGDDVLLYRGEFVYRGDERSYKGDIRFRSRPFPRIEVRGQRPTTPADVSDLLSDTGRPGMWVEFGEVAVEPGQQKTFLEPSSIWLVGADARAGHPSMGRSEAALLRNDHDTLRLCSHVVPAPHDEAAEIRLVLQQVKAC